jgi:hypothetical protein
LFAAGEAERCAARVLVLTGRGLNRNSKVVDRKMIQRIDEIQVILMLEETLKYHWVQHLKILTPPDDNSWIYVRADGLQPQQVNELLDIFIAEVQAYNVAMIYPGLWIYVDGRHWLNSYAADSELFFEQWFSGLSSIFRLGENSETSVSIVEGCSVVMKRETDQLILLVFPFYSKAGVASTSITVNLWNFTHHLIKAGEVYLQLIETLLAAIEAYDKLKNVHTELTCIIEVLVQVRTDYIQACLNEFRSELAKRSSIQS